jgi:hypothetical protein
LPIALCGLSSLLVSTPSLAFSTRVVEAHEPMRIEALRPSVRNLPLNDSMKALSVGLPGAM